MDITSVPVGATIRAFIHYGGAGVGYGKTDMSFTPDENGYVHVDMDYINDLTGRGPVPPEELYVDELWTDAGSWTWDGIKLPDAVDVTTWAPSWYQICIALESPNMGEQGEITDTLYTDYAVFRTPEPATALIMALGATIISLRRRKC
jgi:hypothetical protein